MKEKIKRSIITIVAFLLNIIFLGWLLYVLIKEGWRGIVGEDILLVSLLFLLPIINILALLKKHKTK